MTLGDLIKKYRTEHGYSMDDFSSKSGLSKAYISMLERNRNSVNGKPVTPSLETIKAVSSAINIDFNDVIAMLDGDQEVSLIPPGFDPLPDMEEIPLVGRIACGEPITAKENLEGYVSAPAMWHATFALICKGDSMEPTICDGDLVAIKKGVQIENGQIAAVRIGDEATLKRVYIHKDYIELRPENPAYTSIILRKEEISEVAIEGLAVGLCRGL